MLTKVFLWMLGAAIAKALWRRFRPGWNLGSNLLQDPEAYDAWRERQKEIEKASRPGSC